MPVDYKACPHRKNLRTLYSAGANRQMQRCECALLSAACGGYQHTVDEGVCAECAKAGNPDMKANDALKRWALKLVLLPFGSNIRGPDWHQRRMKQIEILMDDYGYTSDDIMSLVLDSADKATINEKGEIVTTITEEEAVDLMLHAEIISEEKA